jgi:hypothetical protein
MNLAMTTSGFIKKGLCDALSNVDVSGSFSCFHVLDFFPNPGLFIRGVGNIGLPLSIRDAEAIGSSPVTQQSPFGKDSQTLVEASVRKSWQIDPARFYLRNPKLDHQVKRIVATVAWSRMLLVAQRMLLQSSKNYPYTKKMLPSCRIRMGRRLTECSIP